MVAEISPQVSHVEIELRDISDGCCPDSVFATPTYVLDGRTIYLGNPTLEELLAKLGATVASKP